MDLKKKKIGVLMGGLSAEREVSLRSGYNVYQALLRKNYRAIQIQLDSTDEIVPSLSKVDLVFSCLHGGIGEDGTLHALFDILGFPYVGSGVLACALAMNKLQTKRIFNSQGLRTAPWVEYQNEAWDEWRSRVLEEIGLPCVVKPVAEGSSLGVHIIRDEAKLLAACQATQEQYKNFFVEKFITGTEITAGILRIAGEDRALPLIELRPKREFYDYVAKYTPGMTEFIVPAAIDEKKREQIQEMCLRAHQALGCFGFSRVDLMLAEAGEPYLLEVNTLPGMTDTSDLPMAAKALGIDFDDLVEKMLYTAVERTNASIPVKTN
jgi:D-alanine-D-alanine ligase